MISSPFQQIRKEIGYARHKWKPQELERDDSQSHLEAFCAGWGKAPGLSLPLVYACQHYARSFRYLEYVVAEGYIVTLFRESSIILVIEIGEYAIFRIIAKYATLYKYVIVIADFYSAVRVINL